MSMTKRYLEELSEKLGYGGEINDEVMKAAIDDTASKIDRSKDLLEENKMELWELRYKHEKDVRDAQCEALNIPIPEEKEYGTLHRVKDIWRKFEGVKFWKNMIAKGHDKMVFDQCKCKKGELK